MSMTAWPAPFPSRLIRSLWPVAGGIFFLLALSGCSLGGDVQPPPGYSSRPVNDSALANFSPLMPPDPSGAGEIYAEDCAPCHGDTGMGDGSMANQLPVPAPAIGSPEIARAASPAEWFEVISNGRMSRNMPPFSGSLSERQRWNLIAYVMTMNTPAAQLAAGHDTYVMLCQDCHGETGKGNGLRAADLKTAPPDWTNPIKLAQLSDEDIWQAITKGVGSEMPAYDGSIKPDMRWALASYVRTLGFVPGSVAPLDSLAASQPGKSIQDQKPTTEPETAAIRVKVSNDSGGQVPVGLEVNLQGYDQAGLATEYTCALQADQTCAIEGVELASQRVYVASADYQEQRYYSNSLQPGDIPVGQQTDLPLSIYDTTTDQSQILAEQVHVFLEFPEPGVLHVSELFLIHNLGSQVTVLGFNLPPEATRQQLENSTQAGRFAAPANGVGYTAPLLPGDDLNQVLLAYDLPYSRKLPLSLEMPLPAQIVMVMLPVEDGVRLSSEQLRDMGRQSIDDTSIDLYGANDLTAGQSISMTLSGRPRIAPLVNRGTMAGMIFGGAILFAVLGFSGLWVYRRRQAAHPQPAPVEAKAAPLPSLDELLDAIVTLDDLYRSGQLPIEAYQERRAELKEKLRRKKEESKKENRA